jgi:Spy/CpxP family protein refolding chaperone
LGISTRADYWSNSILGLNKELLMNKKRCPQPFTVAAGFFLLCAAPGLTRGAQMASPGPAQAPKMASPAAQAKKDSDPLDDFAGLNYTDEQKAEIEKVRLDTRKRREAVAKDEKLSADQKDAMLLGYTRIEYGRIYEVLSPDQKRQISQRARARRAADDAARTKQQPPSNQKSNAPAK